MPEKSLHHYRLHVRRAGQGPPLVLIHGVAGSGAIWGRVATELEKYFDVIRLDLLGYGYSPKPTVRYTMSIHINAIRSTLRHLDLQEKPLLIGLSMGSLLALEYAARYVDDVRAVVCVGLPYYTSAQAARRSLAGSFWARMVLQMPRLARLVIPIVWGTASNRRIYAFATKLRRDKLVYEGEAAREAMMTTHQSFATTLQECLVHYRLDSSLSKITVPTLFIHGTHDQWTPLADIKKLASRLPRSKVVDVAGIPHNAVAFAPTIVTESVKDFFASLKSQKFSEETVRKI